MKNQIVIVIQASDREEEWISMAEIMSRYMAGYPDRNPASPDAMDMGTCSDDGLRERQWRLMRREVPDNTPLPASPEDIVGRSE